jgi:hypothetical protein
MNSANDDAFEAGRQARRNGQPLESNPHFGGGKTEAANQWKWADGWNNENKALQANRTAECNDGILSPTPVA